MLLRAKMVERAGDYAWSSFAFHGEGRADPLLDAAPGYDALAAYAAVRQRRWSAYVQQEAEEEELAAIRRSGETGLPYGEKTWVDRLCRRLKLDLTIRPRGRPRKGAVASFGQKPGENGGFQAQTAFSYDFSANFH
jgi:putative transposase